MINQPLVPQQMQKPETLALKHMFEKNYWPIRQWAALQ
jgi:hypothetical protein